MGDRGWLSGALLVRMMEAGIPVKGIFLIRCSVGEDFLPEEPVAFHPCIDEWPHAFEIVGINRLPNCVVVEASIASWGESESGNLAALG
jgi:hypothetical protein